jgi:hypothetical protein
MATELALAKRRNEAYTRINTAAQALAKGHKLHLDDASALRHRDPGIEQTMRVESIADTLEAIVKAQAKTGKEVEAQLEAETGHDVVKTGDNPPTYVETSKPKVPRKP